MILKWIKSLLKDRNRVTVNGVFPVRKVSTRYVLELLTFNIFINDKIKRLQSLLMIQIYSECKDCKN